MTDQKLHRRRLMADRPSHVALAALLLAFPAHVAAQVNVSRQPDITAAPSASPSSSVVSPATDTQRPDEGGEIIVTALKRSTLLERTPIAISVLGGDALTARGITQLRDLKASVPSVAFNESPGGLTGISIRGVGTSASSQAFEQSVGLFLDGIYQPRARQYRDGLFDIDQVEVIKGSQGVLFGKNTSVGAISIRTRSPGDHLAGDIQGSYETEFGSYQIQGGVDLPVGDNAGFRLAGLFEDEGGYVRNVTLNRDEPDTVRGIARLTFRAQATPELSINIKVQGGHFRTRGDAFEYTDVTNPGILLAAGVADAGSNPYRKYEFSGILGDSSDEQTSLNLSSNISYDFGPVTLTSLTGYSFYHFANGFDADGSPQALDHQQFYEHFDQVTQEVRLATNGTGPVQVTAGVFYLNQDDSFTISHNFLNFRTVLTGNRLQQFRQQEETYSGFGQAIWTIAGGLKATVGARFSHDHKDGVYAKTIGPVGTIPMSALFPAFAPPGRIAGVISNDNFDFSGTLSYDLSSRAIVYGSAGRGTKGGGFNNTSLSGNALPDPFTVRPERATTYEIGIKGRFLDNRIYASVAGWITDIHSFQDAYYNSLRNGYVIRSLGAKTRGVEGEVRATVVKGLTLFGNISYLPTAKLETGERMQRAPRLTSLAGAQISVPVGPYAFGLSGDWNHSDSFLNQAPSAPGANESGSFDLFGLRASVNYRPANLEVFVAGANLSDARYKTFSFAGVLGAGTVGTYNRPRTITVGARKTF